MSYSRGDVYYIERRSSVVPVTNARELRMAYEMLDYYQQMLPTVSKNDLYEEHIKEMKRTIRAYLKKPDDGRRIVRDDGIDGYVLLLPLPAFIQDMAQAVEWFGSEEYIQPTYSAYDCTGRPFTNWFKIFWRRDGFWAYHSVGFNV